MWLIGNGLRISSGFRLGSSGPDSVCASFGTAAILMITIFRPSVLSSAYLFGLLVILAALGISIREIMTGWRGAWAH